MYQGAANNLQASLTKNLQELAEAGACPNVDVVVRQVNLAGERQDWHVGADGLESANLGPQPGPADSSDPAELSQFIRSAMARYPAKHYLLMVSSHGQGAHGLIEDDRVHRKMDLSEFAQALGPRKLDVVFFDACRMMTAEVAYELKDKADFLVGSMDRIESVGYDPAVLLGELARCNDPKELSHRLVQNQEARQLESFCTLSATQLGEMPKLKEALSELSLQLSQLEPGQAQQLREQLQLARRSLPSPGFQDALFNQGCSLLNGPDPAELREWVADSRPKDPLSLVDLCRVLQESDVPQLRECAERVLQVHDEVVFSQRDGSCDGLSILLPLERGSDWSWPGNRLTEESGWGTAAEHLIPAGSPAVLPLTWVEQELQRRS